MQNVYKKLYLVSGLHVVVPEKTVRRDHKNLQLRRQHTPAAIFHFYECLFHVYERPDPFVGLRRTLRIRRVYESLWNAF